MKTSNYNYVNNLREDILEGKFGIEPSKLHVTGSSYIYQTTQFPNSDTKYHNHYLLVRVESYFGACSHTTEQLNLPIAEELSGQTLDKVILDKRLPVQIAAMDAYLGVALPHNDNCKEIYEIKPGTPIQKANERDTVISKLANIERSQKVALIGVVNPLVEAIEKQNGVCLPCDLNLQKTSNGIVVEKDMEKVLDKADNIICTAMTLSNGTFDRILYRAREKNIPLTVYAQTGSAVIARFIGKGVTSLIAEPFPFSQFSALNTQLYCYYSKEIEK